MSNVKKIIISIASILSICLVGCQADTEPIAESVDIIEETTTESESTEAPSSETVTVSSEETTASEETSGTTDMSGSEFAVPIANITKELLSKYSENNDSGMISGYSAYSALMYLHPYAAGQTFDEIDTLLGQPDVQRFRDSQPGRPEKQDNASDGEILVGIEEPAQFYTSGLFIVDDDTILNTDDTSGFDFRDLQDESIVPYINDYVSENTNKLIPSLIDMPFDINSRAVIIDTLYFKASWVSKFEETATTEDIFYGKDRETTIDYMQQTENLVRWNNIIRLYYNDTPIVMDVVKDIENVESGFEYYLDNCDKLTDSQKTMLKLPKFTTETSIDMKEMLASMGLKTAFTESADFTKLADDLFISDVLQKTKIAVDEQGTEAAAVTMIVAKDTCAMIEPEQPIEFIVNKPFLYILKNTETNEILFAGYYYNI